MCKAPQRFRKHWKDNSIDAAVVAISLKELVEQTSLESILWDSFFLKFEEIPEIEDALKQGFFGEINGHKTLNTKEQAVGSYMLLWRDFGNIWTVAIVTAKLALVLKITASELVTIASTNNQMKHLSTANWEYFLKGVSS